MCEAQKCASTLHRGGSPGSAAWCPCSKAVELDIGVEASIDEYISWTMKLSYFRASIAGTINSLGCGFQLVQESSHAGISYSFITLRVKINSKTELALLYYLVGRLFYAAIAQPCRHQCAILAYGSRGLPLVHFSAQPKHLLRDTLGGYSVVSVDKKRLRLSSELDELVCEAPDRTRPRVRMARARADGP